MSSRAELRGDVDEMAGRELIEFVLSGTGQQRTLRSRRAIGWVFRGGSWMELQKKRGGRVAELELTFSSSRSVVC